MVIGVEPESLEIGFEPSPTVANVLPDVKERVLKVLASWGVSYKKKEK